VRDHRSGPASSTRKVLVSPRVSAMLGCMGCLVGWSCVEAGRGGWGGGPTLCAHHMCTVWDRWYGLLLLHCLLPVQEPASLHRSLHMLASYVLCCVLVQAPPAPGLLLHCLAINSKPCHWMLTLESPMPHMLCAAGCQPRVRQRQRGRQRELQLVV
jgi:hypothetical protein